MDINSLSYFDIYLLNSCILTVIALYWLFSSWFKKS